MIVFSEKWNETFKVGVFIIADVAEIWKMKFKEATKQFFGVCFHESKCWDCKDVALLQFWCVYYRASYS